MKSFTVINSFPTASGTMAPVNPLDPVEQKLVWTDKELHGSSSFNAQLGELLRQKMEATPPASYRRN